MADDDSDPPGRAFRRLPSSRRREEIIAAGVEVFGHRPEPDVSIDDVAAAAGTSRSSVYRYFDGKNELYAAVADRVGRDLTDRLERATGDTPSALLMARLTLYFDFVEQYAGGYAGILGISDTRAPDGALAAARAVRDRICALTYRTLDVTDPSPLLELTVRAWIASVESAGVQWLATRTPPRRHIETTLAAQFMTQLVAASPLDPLCADRVTWLLGTEPPDSPLAALIQAITTTFDRRTVIHLAALLAAPS
ncbi:TetR/AcrR family transcriptional regulator [Actinomadura flavalba]|uniref:TetR/AcrR family transcriptional regulator n=1 Tax=Actinomadura flavalba TaxID=1120938 RepID=UPI0003703B1B|nr:TetR/AcrR family transcriptional regulator [Actinomadura flavalba]